jgi:hypothetical protein
MKKFKKYLFLLLSLIIFIPFSVKAASGTVSISGSSNAVVNGKVTVTVKIASSAGLGSWQMGLNYDKSYLQLTSSSAEAGGTYMANSSSSAISSKSYTFTFKALKTGSTSLSVDSYLAYAFSDLSEIKLSASGKTISIKTQEEIEASYSKDNTLRSLSVDGFTLTPAFNKDTTDYKIEVPEDTKSINIVAKANDSKSSVSGAGSVDVSAGTNKFNIIVKAENGSEKTYTINVDVKDINPISVKIDGKDYTVVKVKENLEKPTSFEETTVKINDIEVPGFYNEVTKTTLVGLKDTDGNIKLYIYDEKKNTYTLYSALNFNSISFQVLKTDKKIKGYQEYQEKINDTDVTVLKYSKDSRYSLIYGINMNNGEEGYYMILVIH